MRLRPEAKDKANTIHCPACDKKIGSEAIDSYKSYKLYHCSACDLMFWHPMESPSPDWYEDFYGPSIDLISFRTVKILWAQQQFFKDMPVLGGRLLDIGCGVGDFLYVTQKAGFSVAGIDFSPKFIETVRRRFGIEELYTLTLEDFATQRPEDKFDVITFFEVLEHLEDINGFLHSVRKLLKPRGYVACSVPDRERWRFYSKWFLSQISQERDYPPHHLTRWNPQAVANLFGNCGFSVSKIKRQPLTLGSFKYGGWLVGSALGIRQRGVALAKKLITRGSRQSNISQELSSSTARGALVRLGGKLYYEVFVSLLGLVALPLWLLLRKRGGTVYVLAKMRVAN